MAGDSSFVPPDDHIPRAIRLAARYAALFLRPYSALPWPAVALAKAEGAGVAQKMWRAREPLFLSGDGRGGAPERATCEGVVFDRTNE